MRVPSKRYRSATADSGRWNGFELRDGDIVISAPIKCGSTWVQTICALLIFKTRAFPATLDIISPWLDMVLRPQADVLGDLAAQKHRRFVKSHTPLDGLPFHEPVTYICIGRDPRDAALSFDNHMANMNESAFLAARYRASGLDEFAGITHEQPAACADTRRERFWRWVGEPGSTDDSTPGLHAMIHHLSTFWEARECPNVVLLHFDDLLADLEGEMRRLARKLNVAVPQALWSELVRAATFEDMRKRADEIVPNATDHLWHDNARFFNKGTSGQWRELLDADDLRRYRDRITALAPPDLVTWIHRGPIVG